MTESAPEGLPASGNETAAVSRKQSAGDTFFFGPNGLRAGWRLLLFLALVVTMQTALQQIKPLQDFIRSLHPPHVVTAARLIAEEALNFLTVLLAAVIMARVEKRTFADYGLPPNRAFGKKFWSGIPVGFGMLTVLLGLIAAFRGFSPGTLALTGASALKYGALWGIGCLLVGFFEEFSFRGYMQSTLGSGIGFWPAALALALVFGAIHLGNRGEGILGAIAAGLFGLVEAFSLWRTGSIWFAIGMHASWDWGQSFVYGVPDSGQMAPGRLLNSSFHGSHWLTGGTIGPEGSLLVFPTLLLMAAIIHFLYPARRTNP
jgi:uncharacterized protein